MTTRRWAGRDPLLVIFDCDGVLVDSEVLVLRIEQRLLAARGIDLSVHEIAARYVGLSDAEMARRVDAEFGLTLDDAFDQDRHREMVHAFDTSLEPVAGITEVLERLRPPRCVASSSNPERIDHSLSVTGLDTLIGPHRFSAAQVEHGKPAPDLFLLAASSMGADPSSCIVVEDSPFGVEAGVAAGMHVIGFSAGRHCGPGHEHQLRDAGCHAVASSSAQLDSLLR